MFEPRRLGGASLYLAAPGKKEFTRHLANIPVAVRLMTAASGSKWRFDGSASRPAP